MIDKKNDLQAEGENFLKWDFFKNPSVISDLINPVQKTVKKLIKKSKKDLRIIDLGTGTGIIIKNIKQKIESQENNKLYNLIFYGVDCLDELIKKNQEEAPDIKWICSDNKNLPFRDQSFDIVVMRNTLHYEENYENQKKVICEAYRILKYSGYIIDFQSCFPTLLETNLIRNIYSVLPKAIKMQTISEFKTLHKTIFGNVKLLSNPNSRNLLVSKDLLTKRYMTKLEQLEIIRNKILDIPEKNRPNFHISEKDFWFTIPQRIVKCQKIK
ncbi:MAG TPA: class I SAM-dependent methyltransferase [Alphaproteobacteria bacterium]|nr:class I SAM-dependent methyltransferase [Alphaproteobacteria bacterium]